MIIDPVVLTIDSYVKDAKENMAQYKIGGIPIVDDQTVCWESWPIGIYVLKNDARPISEVMTSDNLITVKEGTSLKRPRLSFKT